jgi:hypothetical protein
MDNPKYGDNVRYDKGVVGNAIKSGCVDVLDWLSQRKTITLTPYYYYYASLGGHLSLMKWLYSKGVPMTEDVADIVYIDADRDKKKNTLSIIQWMLDTFPNIILEDRTLGDVFNSASSDIIRCLVSNGYKCDETVCSKAVGDLELLRWLIERGCPTDATICGKMAELGDIDLLKEMVGLGCEVDDLSFSNAAERGDIGMLEYLLIFDDYREYADAILETGVMSGRLDVVKWAVSVGYEITDDVLEYAQLGGYQDIIEFCMSLI